MSVSVSSEKSVREAYEADASGLHLVPELVARPESVDDVIELVRKAASDRIPITCAGAQTKYDRGFDHRQGNTALSPLARPDFGSRRESANDQG